MKLIAAWRSLEARKEGYALVTAIIAAAIISGLGVVMMNRATASVRQQQASVEADQSWFLAMSGIEHCMANLRYKGIWVKIMITDTATPDERRCAGSLNGGTYAAQVEWYEPGKVKIVSTGNYGRFSKTLTGIVAWTSQSPLDNEGAIVAGGEWLFNGNTNIKGTLATTGSMDLRSHSVVVCGQLYAAGTIDYVEANLDRTPSCQTIDPRSHVSGIKMYDDTRTLNAIMAGAAYKRVGDMLCPKTSGPDKCDLNHSTVYVTGTLTFKKDFVFPRNNTVIVANKVEFTSPSGTVSAPPVPAGTKPAIYIYTVPGPEGSKSCTEMATAGPALKPSYVRVDISSGYVIRNVTFWSKTGLVEPQSNVDMKGRIYSQCVSTNSSFKFEPGSALPPDQDLGLPGLPSYEDTVWLLSVY